MKAMLKLTAVSALFASHFAFAGTYDLGNLGPPGIGTVVATQNKVADFSDDFKFSINSDAAVYGNAADTVKFSLELNQDLGIDNWQVELFKSDNTLVSTWLNSPSSNTLTNKGSFSFASLSSGSYYFRVTGSVRGLVNGSASYAVTLLTLKNATAVPENDAYAMMLAGLGLVGFAARRKISA